MSDKRFHVFVRRVSAGVSVHVVTHPHLCAFAADLDDARADLSHVLGKLLVRGDLWTEPCWFADARMRRVELTIRALQRGRLLPVPMRFSVLTYSTQEVAPRMNAEGQMVDHLVTAKPRRAKSRRDAGDGVEVLVPRLGLRGHLADIADLPIFVEELVRNALYLKPLDELLALGYSGEETIDTMIVSAREREPRAERAAAEKKKKSTRAPLPPALGEACRRLNDEVQTSAVERAFCREVEIALLEGVVSARTRTSALLVGPTAAGKSCLVHELAHRAADESSSVHGLEIYSTSGGRIIAGMRYLGQWQHRLSEMISELRSRRAVLHLESLAELLSIGGGGGSGDSVDLARFLLPAIESGDLAVITEATPEDVARAERTHPALVQAMRPIVVDPLNPVDARQALASAGSRIARARHARFHDAALERALDLTERFGDGALPGTAVALLRDAAQELPVSVSVSESPAPPAPTSSARTPIRTITAEAITTAFTRRTGYPRALIDPTVTLDPAAVLAHFRARVIDQDEAMTLFANLIVTLKTNLADPSRPLGSFLLLGPTGVGKTESALALCAYLFGDDKRLARFDMAEYAAPGSALRLVSTTGNESTLARRVREQPFGVVLLDEVEKADSGVHDLLLQILGEGRLTDGTGRAVSFRNTIVVLTSNLGADSAGRSLGFGSGASTAHDTHYRAAAAAFFRPELLNRFDAVLPYRPLSKAAIAQLARRSLTSALAREGLTRRGVRVEWDEAVVARLAELGFDPRLGARPLKRAIERLVVAPLARVLAGRGDGAVLAARLVVRGDGEIGVEAG